jgi:hypothetical protein
MVYKASEIEYTAWDVPMLLSLVLGEMSLLREAPAKKYISK